MTSHNKPEKRKSKFRTIMRKILKSKVWLILGAMMMVFLCTATICATVFISYMMSIDNTIDIEIEAMKLNYSSIVYYVDENGAEHEYERLYDTQNRTWVNLEDMPTYLKDAAIAIEDHRFMSHNGVDWKRTLGASVNMFFKMKSDFGASTITQQLVKNLTGDNQDSVKRKLQEIRRALYLEEHYDKDTIIELYLNTIFLGEGCYGVGTAAHAYYDKDVSELTLAESAALIGITNLPTYYNPYLHPDNNRDRRNNIINRMYELDMISKDERDAALEEEIVFNSKKHEDEETSVQSYFVDQIIEDVLDDLVNEYGYPKNIALRTIYSGGLKIYATVDPEIQNKMDAVFDAEDTFPTYKGSVQPECAMILLDPQNGNVIAMRGGRGEKTGARVFNRATQSKRPPGSTIKPIAVYAPAIEYGLVTPFSVEDDAPIPEESRNAKNGEKARIYPKNENKQYSGRTTITHAVEQSINTVSMRLLKKLSPERSYNFLISNLGFTTLSSKNDRNLAPLALGQLTYGATVLEMAAAYSPFANGGTYYKPRTYTKVLDNNGEVLLSNSIKPVNAMSEKTASYMHYMLQNVVTRGTGKSAQLERGMPAAAKTGTSDNDEDRWFVGYTPYYVGAVWFGYDQPKYFDVKLSPALTVWEKVMNSVHEDLEVKAFDSNPDFKLVNVCSKSGMLPTDACRIDPRGSQIVAGYYHKDDVPKRSCNVHKTVEIDTETNMIATEFCPAESKKTISLMDIDRTFPVPGVTVLDEQYVIHNDTLPADQYRFASSVANIYDTSCTLHTAPAESEESSPPEDSPSLPPSDDKLPDPETPDLPPKKDEDNDSSDDDNVEPLPEDNDDASSSSPDEVPSPEDTLPAEIQQTE